MISIMHELKQQKDHVVQYQSATLTRRRKRSTASSQIKPTMQNLYNGVTSMLPIVILLLATASRFSSCVSASHFGINLGRNHLRTAISNTQQVITKQSRTDRILTQYKEENEESDLTENVNEITTNNDSDEEVGVDGVRTSNNSAEPPTDKELMDNVQSSAGTPPGPLVPSPTTESNRNSSDIDESPMDDPVSVLVNSTIAHDVSGFEGLINPTETESIDDTNESSVQMANETDIDQPIGNEANKNKTKHAAKTETHAKGSTSSLKTNAESNTLVSEPATKTSIYNEENVVNATTNVDSSYGSEIDESLRNKALSSENLMTETIDESNAIVTREEKLEGNKDTTNSHLIENSSSVNEPDGNGLINNNFEDNKFDSILEDSTISVEPSQNGEASDNDGSLLHKINNEEIEFEIVLISFGCISLILMIVTAYQMSENPDGMYASICRFTIGIILSIWSFLRYPCCKPKINAGRTNRQSYGHLPLSTKEYGYNDPTLEIH